ncbi:dihydrolipoamide acetyltransferase family protein [Sinomonas albida]|uniref:dihydrolipoamide acetyltransferase family protein n=1 Tax=Sinomonas albida TaxID=369942 RepID=UPI0010A85794|nr:dihydrolipoamide acetyltransferase family protein [Sinomonas albida]
MAVARDFLLPDLGEGLTEAELVRWLVAVGDSVVVDQPVVEVETAKAVVEVPSPFAGVVTVLHGQPGETLDVGRPLISIDEGKADAGPTGTAKTGAAKTGTAKTGEGKTAEATASGAEAYRTEERAGSRPEGASGPGAASGTASGTASGSGAAPAGSGNVLIGYGTSGSTSGGRTRRRKGAAVSAEAGVSQGTVASQDTRVSHGTSVSRGAAAVATLLEPSQPEPSEPESLPARAVRVVSPLVRKLARDLGVDLRSLSGSGPDGLILRRDVEVAAPSAESQTLNSAQPAAASEPAVALAGPGETDALTGLGIAVRTPMRGMRRAVAQAMSRSRSEIPEATVWVDADATELVELRADLKRRDPDNTPSLLAFIARFVVAGLAKFPELNARIEAADDGGQEIVAFDGVNLGFAAQTERGLVVPSIRNAHALSARGLDSELRRLTAVARDGKATPADLSGSTFTLNNYGVFGVDGSAAIINYPEAAILGVGRIVDRPWAVDGQLAVRKVVELTLVFDHRVCDGGTAGGFLRYVADAVEHPGSVLADL